MVFKFKVKRLFALLCILVIFANVCVVVTSAETVCQNLRSANCGKRLGLDAFTDEGEFYVNNGKSRTFTAKKDGTLDGVEIEAVINFGAGSRQNMLFFGNTNWSGIYIVSYSVNNLAVYTASLGTPTWSNSQIITQNSSKGVPQITNTDIKYTFGFAFSNMSADGKTTDVTMTVTVEDSYSYQFTVKNAPVSNLRRKLLIYGADSHEFSFKKAYTNLSLNDFGISGRNEIRNERLFATANSDASLNNYEIYGNLCLNNSAQAVYFGGNKAGIKLALSSNAVLDSYDLSVGYQHGDNTYHCGVITCDALNFESFENYNFTFTVNFLFSKAKPSADRENVYVSLCIDGVRRFYYLLKDVYADDFKQYIFACSYSDILVIGDPTVKTDYTDISLSDFSEISALTDENGVIQTAFQTGKYSGSSLDGTCFNAYITPTAGSRISFGTDDKSDWNGVNIDFYDTFIRLNDDIYNSISSTAIHSDNVGINFTGNKYKLSVTFDYIDSDNTSEKDDLLLGIYINDNLINSSAYVLKNRVNTFGNRIMFYSESGNIKVEGIEYLELSDLAISEDKYNRNITSMVYGKYCNKSSLLNTSLSFDVTIDSLGSYINLAGKSEWTGIRIVFDGVNFFNIIPATAEFTQRLCVTSADAGVGSFINNKMHLKTEIMQNGLDAVLKLYVNGKRCANMTLTGAAQKLGNYTGFYSASGNVNLGGETEPEYYNLAYGPYMFSAKENNLRVNFGPMKDWITSTPGDYYLSAFGAEGTGEGKYAKKVVLYYYGDANTDGQLDVCDLVSAARYIDGVDPKSQAGYLGADVNRDGAVELSDMNDMCEKILSDNTTLNLKDNAFTFHRNVMPIGGYNGPSTEAQITDKIYSIIKNVGINFINVSGLGYGLNAANSGEEALLLKALKKSQNYGIDMLVTDSNAGGSASNISSRYLSKFNHFKSFKGYYIVDEPVSNFYGNAVNASFDSIKGSASLFNSFANLFGFVNLLPMTDVDNLTDYSKEVAYREYIDECVRCCNPKFLSFDDYPFSVFEGTGETQEAYFGSLTAIREKSLQYGIPFWSYIQAGANFPKLANVGCTAATANNSPTEAQSIWTVNTALAYGTKGIIYFPLIQPDYFAKTNHGKGKADYDRNGIIGADLTTITRWANYAKIANKQVSKVDEFLLNAKTTEILAVGEAPQRCTGISKTVDSNGILKSVIADSGAIIGVFEYRGKTAFYVVNNDTVNEQNITLNFNGKYTVNGYSEQCKSSLEKEVANSYNLNLIAGGGAFIIVSE